MALPTAEFMTTTANFLDGYRTVRTFGVVRGITVRSRSVFGTIGAAFQQLRGGEVSPADGALRTHPPRCVRARDRARA
jgi:uncharacterized protein YbjQ (UPF0145 family)